MTCKDCKYWEQLQCKLHFGNCHRYPLRYKGKWPVCFCEDWCGEYQLREIKSPIEKAKSTDVVTVDLQKVLAQKFWKQKKPDKIKLYTKQIYFCSECPHYRLDMNHCWCDAVIDAPNIITEGHKIAAWCPLKDYVELKDEKSEKLDS